MEKKFKITVDGREYHVTVEDQSSGSLTLPDAGSMMIPERTVTAPVVAAPAPSSAAPSGPAGVGVETSPLGGVVNAIEVSVGQSVNNGDLIAVIEAMKMKTNLYAHSSGKVASIAVKLGEAVDKGQPILTIQ